jgi:hypothetical protein
MEAQPGGRHAERIHVIAVRLLDLDLRARQYVSDFGRCSHHRGRSVSTGTAFRYQGEQFLAQRSGHGAPTPTAHGRGFDFACRRAKDSGIAPRAAERTRRDRGSESRSDCCHAAVLGRHRRRVVTARLTELHTRPQTATGATPQGVALLRDREHSGRNQRAAPRASQEHSRQFDDQRCNARRPALELAEEPSAACASKHKRPYGSCLDSLLARATAVSGWSARLSCAQSISTLRSRTMTTR